MEQKILDQYQLWVEKATEDPDVVGELKAMNGDEVKIEDAFYRNLAFGTGGLRGTIGAGTNRMNVHTVAKATQGLANYLNRNFTEPSVSIGYDSRIKSDVFAKVAAGVFAANGVKVNIWPELLPVPTVSFATRYLGTSAGVMVTASHNPSKYNGYKVYGPDGCQMTTEAAAQVLSEIEKLDIFSDVKTMNFEDGFHSGIITYISDDVLTAFIEEVKGQSCLGGYQVDKNAAIVYSPLNGTGLKPVTRTLREMGYTNITVVKEQEQPDGNFPTCPYPNPEIREAMELGMEYAKRCHADLECSGRICPAFRKRDRYAPAGLHLLPQNCQWYDACRSRYGQDHRDDGSGGTDCQSLRCSNGQCTDRIQVYRRTDRLAGETGKSGFLYFWF